MRSDMPRRFHAISSNNDAWNGTIFERLIIFGKDRASNKC